jgi:hypothetical protein
MKRVFLVVIPLLLFVLYQTKAIRADEVPQSVLEDIRSGRIQAHLATPAEHPLEFALSYEVADEIYRACNWNTAAYRETRRTMEQMLGSYMLLYYPVGRVTVSGNANSVEVWTKIGQEAFKRLGAAKQAREALKPKARGVAQAILDHFGGCSADTMSSFISNLSRLPTFSASTPPEGYAGPVLVEEERTLDQSGFLCIYDDDPKDMRALRQRFFVLTPTTSMMYGSQVGLAFLDKAKEGGKIPMIRTACPGTPDPDFFLEQIHREPVLPPPSGEGGSRPERLANYYVDIFGPALAQENNWSTDKALLARVRQFIIDWEGVDVPQAELEALWKGCIEREKSNGENKAEIAKECGQSSRSYDDTLRWRLYNQQFGKFDGSDGKYRVWVYGYTTRRGSEPFRSIH